MKNIKNLSLLITIGLLLGCEKSYPTYPNLDGEYVIDHVIVLTEDRVYGWREDTIYHYGSFSLFEPQTPLDTFLVSMTRFKFTDNNRTFYWNKDTTVFGNPWRSKAECTVRQDILSGEWDVISVHFTLTNTVSRVYEISYIGIDEFSVWQTQYPFKAEGPQHKVKYHFKEVGP